ncbi:arf-GAP with coiled-coil, ANK repeat and PH domain-containing protein 2-like isoform X2 [Brevipalpus obovatus]|uniref:arf-GAP with coiled-coil, ANK repeat and PH domain-containing protein 2-like isoform X2 n=1 Tax=Brevipalpus obovatus TaxID=246614 RepID=UPI003D9DF9C9
MKAIVDIKDCLSDSPTFRTTLQQNEDDIHALETKLEKIVKLCNDMIESSQNSIRTKAAFINGVFELSVYFKDDPPVVNALDENNKILKKLLQYESMLVDQMNRAVSRNLNNFLKRDINKVKETKRHFDKISEDYDNLLVRNSTCLKSKASESEELSNLLKATRSLFQHTALDYVCQMSCLQSKKRYEVVDSLLLLVQAYGTYFHQGSDILNDFDVKNILSSIQEMREDTQALHRELEHNHSLVEEKPCSISSDGQSIRSQGYLFKRTTNAFKTWNRRWFMIQNNRLIYQKRSEKNYTVMEEDLRLCNVKPVTEGERRFCLEIVSPSRYHMLQADSQESCEQWISSLQAGIDAAYNGAPSENSNEASDSYESCDTSVSSYSAQASTQSNSCPVKSQRVLPIITGLLGNEVCVDCGSSDPQWASINLGVTLCIECSDSWDPEQVKLMTSLGNRLVNSILETEIDEKHKTHKPSPTSNPSERESWIQAKYVKKHFMGNSLESLPDHLEELKVCVRRLESDTRIKELLNHSDGSQIHYDILLYSAALCSNLEYMCRAMLRGARVNWSNPIEKSKTPLHAAVIGGSVPCCEYLLLNGAPCNAQDSDGKSPLHLATEVSNTGIVCLLLKRGADLNLTDSSGSDSLSIAVNNTNADIVTLLRLAKLNEEMQNDEYNNCNEDIFNEVVRDFSNKASIKTQLTKPPD